MPRHLKIVLSITICALLTLASESLCTAATSNKTPNDREVVKAEKILAKLDLLREAAADSATYASVVSKLYPELFINVASLHDGDLKTDLSTAAFLYEQAQGLLRSRDAAATDCRSEARDLYRNLCFGRDSSTRAQFLLAKADLHADWARAIVRYARGNRETETLAIMATIRRERSIDLTIAERAIALLKTLDAKVNPSSSLADFVRTQETVARVSFEQLSNDFRNVSAAISQLLSSLPRSPLAYQLQNALSSYRDGLFYWQQTSKRKELVVSAAKWTEPAEPRAPGFDAGEINYTVVCNWRNARQYLVKATTEIARARESRFASDQPTETLSLAR